MLDRSQRGNSHRVRVLRLQWSDCSNEYRIVSNRARETGNTLLAGREARLPERAEGLPGFGAESEPPAGAAALAVLGPQWCGCQSKAENGYAAQPQRRGAGQYRDRGKSTAPRGPSISQMTSSSL